ncbi:enoyl-CoA hydratase/isomerase family protein [Variovorax sp. PBL-E5]|uniref:enoyl-CoA hydratase/isomerase family protein n=1 Tax=Variovorax sp. PBL-E5 TaxID=434014 RepID=UPI001316D22D|nr:enoyl-CoA hydratase-related protein [Variovorax sp. PBL-E5]VTU39765.1 2,3-dehydroadipyl-CoA hydratase [Variovorax sp. PBL-E5]
MYEHYQHLDFGYRGRILTITMNRPEVRNAANVRMHRELSTVFRDAARDPACDVVVLTGAGTAFSSGGDIVAMQEKIDDRSKWVDTVEEAREIFTGMLELPKPLIARINGAATGLGATLAVYADIAVAAQSAVIGDPHVKVGLVAGDGGALMWPLLVGFQKAKELLFLGDGIPAEEAARIGLIGHCVPDDALDDKVYGIAERLCKVAPLALRWTKRTINHTIRQLAHGTMENGLLMETLSQMTRDHAEAVHAFGEKRPAVFKGR